MSRHKSVAAKAGGPTSTYVWPAPPGQCCSRQSLQPPVLVLRHRGELLRGDVGGAHGAAREQAAVDGGVRALGGQRVAERHVRLSMRDVTVAWGTHMLRVQRSGVGVHRVCGWRQ